MNVPPQVPFVFFLAFILASSAVYFTIQKSVNENLPKEQRFPYFTFRRNLERQFEVLRTYRRMFPDDELPVLYWVFSGLSILAFVFSILNNASHYSS
jgi:hypothetical protein